MIRPVFVVIEDNPFVAAVHKGLIDRICPGGRVVIAKNGFKGIAAVAQYHPAALIVDLDLPQINGVKLLQMLSADEEFQDIPAVAVSELSADEIRKLGYLPESVTVLTKSKNRPELLAAFINKAIERHANVQKAKTVGGTGRPTDRGDQAKFLDKLHELLGFKTDRALARYLSLSPSSVSKIRNQITPINPYFIVRLHEVSGLSLDEIRKISFGTLGGVATME